MWISVPSGTRIIGPGISGARPTSANACIITLGPLSASGNHSASTTSSLSSSFPSRRVPAGLRLSFVGNSPRRRSARWIPVVKRDGDAQRCHGAQKQNGRSSYSLFGRRAGVRKATTRDQTRKEGSERERRQRKLRTKSWQERVAELRRDPRAVQSFSVHLTHLTWALTCMALGVGDITFEMTR